jgi:hypothetical protein
MLLRQRIRKRVGKIVRLLQAVLLPRPRTNSNHR